MNRGSQTRRRKLHIVITAGPTREYLDTVRFISNPSSGKMGYGIARAAAAAGHQVTLVSGPVALPLPTGVRTVQVETGAEMSRATKRAFKSADAAILCAAVCDYRPARAFSKKMPKSANGLPLLLVPTEDIAAALGKMKKHRITIGFALEDHDGRKHALGKLKRKRFDAIVLNDLGNIGGDRAAATLILPDGTSEQWHGQSKQRMGQRIIDLLEKLVASKPASGDKPRMKRRSR